MYSQASYKNQRNDMNQRLTQNLILVNSINYYARTTVNKILNFLKIKA